MVLNNYFFLIIIVYLCIYGIEYFYPVKIIFKQIHLTYTWDRYKFYHSGVCVGERSKTLSNLRPFSRMQLSFLSSAAYDCFVENQLKRQISVMLKHFIVFL